VLVVIVGVCVIVLPELVVVVFTVPVLTVEVSPTGCEPVVVLVRPDIFVSLLNGAAVADNCWKVLTM
jgi:hypothetical protein